VPCRLPAIQKESISYSYCLDMSDLIMPGKGDCDERLHVIAPVARSSIRTTDITATGEEDTHAKLTQQPSLHDKLWTLPTTTRHQLCLKDLASGVSESDLEELFSRLGGRVVRVTINRNSESGKSLKCGFLSMSTDAEALQVMKEMQGCWFKGRAIKISSGGQLDTTSVVCTPKGHKAKSSADGKNVNSVKIDFNMMVAGTEREIDEEALLNIFKTSMPDAPLDSGEAREREEATSSSIIDVSIQAQHYDVSIYGFAFVGFSLSHAGIETARAFQARFNTSSVGAFYFRKCELSNKHHKFVQHFNRTASIATNAAFDGVSYRCNDMHTNSSPVYDNRNSHHSQLQIGQQQQHQPPQQVYLQQGVQAIGQMAEPPLHYMYPILVPGFLGSQYAPVPLPGPMCPPPIAYSHRMAMLPQAQEHEYRHCDQYVSTNGMPVQSVYVQYVGQPTYVIYHQ
jgi:RNA recognition motif-containing protein